MNLNTMVSLVAGMLFGVGLVVGGMTDPAKVIGFLDLAGSWDPSLAFVMGAALCVTLPVFQLVVRRRSRPLLDVRFHLPTRTDLDRRLIAGAAVFGVGWGIAGLCPGPAIANLVSGSPEVLAFVASMVAGMWIHDRLMASSPPAPAQVAPGR